ncbi:hypothetical protein GCM10022420_026760 [Streptomyces iranensis]|uniref:Uncharacterized protein n=1 Tax=Streptomyces iranensis TaxID=576784 RepID=A0A060ZS43_9ACTN|nr:hypothetical protein [Streptomyces iranensis]CDR08656.1 predicted protein [Streptomyces iranensis]
MPRETLGDTVREMPRETLGDTLREMPRDTVRETSRERPAGCRRTARQAVRSCELGYVPVCFGGKRAGFVAERVGGMRESRVCVDVAPCDAPGLP